MESIERMCLFKPSDMTGALYELKKNPNNLNEPIEVKFIDKKQMSHDTFIYTYEIPNDLYLGLNLGQHIVIDAEIISNQFPHGEPVNRKYTPTSPIFLKGKVELLIKVYFGGVHPQFPEGGRMSQYLNDLEIGRSIKIRGPYGKLSYFGDGNFKILKKFRPLTFLEKKYSKVGMIAGGTGITPFYQILQASDLCKDSIEFSLIFANKSSKDILLKEELDLIFKNQNFKFNLIYTIDQMEEGWTGNTGFISKEMILTTCPSPSDDTLMLTCGPPVMCQKYLLPLLLELGHNQDSIFDF